MAATNKTGNNKAKSSGNKSSSGQRASNTSSRGKNTANNQYTKERKAAARAALNDEDDGPSRKNEIYVFIYLAVAVFLICSNFGWCGVIGDFISKILFGLVGTVSYILPLYIFLSAAFLFSNGAHKKVIKRVLCVAIFIIALAFICQLINGADGETVKSLYKNGSLNKQGGGVLLGGLVVILHKLIGFTGCVIVTVLLIIIGIIVVMDVSIIDSMKARMVSFEDDDGDEDDEYIDKDLAKLSGDEIRSLKKDNILGNVMVLESKDTKKTKKKKDKQKNNVVLSEEVHELKPLKATDDFTLGDAIRSDVPIDVSGTRIDFFNKPVTEIKPTLDDGFNDNSDYFGSSAEENINVAPKRKPRRTKESQAEVMEATASVSEDINGVSASAMSISDNSNVSAKLFERQLASIEDSGDEIKREYVFPPINLLKSGRGKAGANNEVSVRETAMKLKSTLESFGVNVTVTDYSCGPSVTRYELQPEQGVKVNKIVGLADDIKLNLAAADIRIEAPIPGKAAIGIEVPNKESSAVYFRDLLESENFKNFNSNIAFAVGKDISGQVVVADIAKMPHLLVAGATGSGKSVCINTLIMSIIYKAKPEDVKMIMIDPKQVELSIYNGIPHMLIPVVTDPKKAAGALNWAVMEMTNRYQLFAQYNVRNLQGYNEKVKAVTGLEDGNEDLKKLPQIILIVDELADLMMVAHHEVEDAIVRLSQLARAAGIHLVIATQRPSVDVITGLIKANVPSRIAMTVSSGVDSRTILDMNGAEKLLGKGDMLFYPTGYPKPVRVQGAFLSDEEIAGVVDFLKSNNGETAYDDKITQEISSTGASGLPGSGGAEPDVDEYFVDAGKFIIGKDKASIGMLQRVYKIGFNRAARIMDQLSEAGVVGPEEGTKPRKVLMTLEEFDNYVENNL
ncbi:MAG: DNA translocase FtsK 4TM domain-containing protein [Lachnospiraceae bacterium]|nr:DNA translocase FtsK 4TM domain-containing protein [Lachnospiraceae bacterium]